MPGWTRRGCKGAGLIWARMQGAVLLLAQMEGAVLIDAQMQGANLGGARMQEADLGEARMLGANLREAQMEGANLFGAWMLGADLSWARMQGANLWAARMDAYTRLDEAEFRGAGLLDLDWSRMPISQGQIDAAFGDGSVILPAGLNRPAHWPQGELDEDDFDPEWRKWQSDPAAFTPPAP